MTRQAESQQEKVHQVNVTLGLDRQFPMGAPAGAWRLSDFSPVSKYVGHSGVVVVKMESFVTKMGVYFIE